jgi:hypothetical protein
MGRSKNLHYVTHLVDVIQPDDAELNWADGTIQVDVELSKELGRTVRNGNSFRLVGYGASLRGFTGASDTDVGFAGTAVVKFCPVTKNAVAAHQGLYKQWMKQKQLAGAVGAYVRYDDFEVGWSDGYELATGRNSVIYTSGMGDTNTEALVIYGGNSSSGGITALEAYYDNLNPIAPVSENPFGNVIKEAKFIDKFPDARELSMPTTFSATGYDTSLGVGYAGAVANGSIEWLPADHHLSHLTGTLFYYFKGLAPDTDVPPANPDELKLAITLVYEGWSSVAPTRNKSNTKRTAKKTLRRKSAKKR